MQATGVITISAVEVFSIVRRKRNHHDETTRRANFADTSPRLSATKPKPPPCNNRSTALKERSRLSLHRTHNKRSKLTCAFAADETSKVSLQSTRAQVSSCALATAKVENNTLVRPDEAVPWTSVIAPRGNPSMKLSISAMPVGKNSAGRFSHSAKTFPKRLCNTEASCSLAIAIFMFASTENDLN